MAKIRKIEITTKCFGSYFDFFPLLVSFFKKSPFHCRFLILTIPLALVAVVIVDADEGAGEGEHLAKGGEYAGVDDASGRYAEGDEDEEHAHAHNRKCQEHLVAGLRLLCESARGFHQASCSFLEMKGNSSHEIWVSRELYYFLLVLLDVSVARVGAATL